MLLKLSDELIEADRVFGPIPEFNDSFERFFIQKAFNLFLNEHQSQTNIGLENDSHKSDKTYSDLNFKYISLSNEIDLNWMHEIELSKNSRQQNMEIIYNDNKVYFKTVKTIYRDEILNAFPSKDLEISLGLQFIPIHADNKYLCKKCSKMFEYQYNLMLHTRYFCSHNTNNLLRNLNKNDQLLCKDLEEAKRNPTKRKLVEFGSTNLKKKLKEKNQSNINDSNCNNNFLEPNLKVLIERSKSSENQISSFNWSEFYKSYQTSMQAYTKNIGSSEQYSALNQINPNLKDYFITQLASYIEVQTKITNDKINSSSPSHFLPSLVNLSPIVSPVGINYSNSYLRNILPNSGFIHNPATSSNTIRNQTSLELNQISNGKKSISNADFKMPLSQNLQNWCAKCNTHFRLTSDLVYHMRTFHRKEESKVNKSTVYDVYKSSKFTEPSSQTSVFNTNGRGIKYLVCEVCNESFKEKHHLTRHLTSHR